MAARKKAAPAAKTSSTPAKPKRQRRPQRDGSEPHPPAKANPRPGHPDFVGHPSSAIRSEN